MSKLEVGMYVRGKYYAYRGKIGKIIKNYNSDLEIAYKNGIVKTTVGSFIEDNYDINGKQYVASFNIIDLIEEGDYIRIATSSKFDHVYYSYGKLVIRDDIDISQYSNNFIAEVITKEQMEQMSYRIGE